MRSETEPFFFRSRLLAVILLGGLACQTSPAMPTDAAAGDGDAPAERPALTDTAEDQPADSKDTPAADGGRETAPGDAAAQGCLGCLDDLHAQCPRPPAGCLTASADTVYLACYANGVKTRIETVGAAHEVTVKKADGSICFRTHVPSTMTSDVDDASGMPVAHIQYSEPRTMFTVSCLQTKEMIDVDLTAPQCAAELAALNPCSPGPCTW